MLEDSFKYTDETFDDIQMLRYNLKGFEDLTLKQKKYIYCLSQATLYGRDITFDQFGKYNLKIRKALEAIYLSRLGDTSEDFKALKLYLKKVWFSNGIYHHYNSDKFVPGFSEDYFVNALNEINLSLLGLDVKERADDFVKTITKVVFDPLFLPKGVNKKDGEDIIRTSACNYYENVSQCEVERFYSDKKSGCKMEAPSYGLNSKLIKVNGDIKEIVWKEDGLYGAAIK